MTEKLGVELSLPHSNRSRRREQPDYRSFYDEELAEAVGRRYQEDCAAFGYSF
ncbi:MAG: hypothetical protein H0V53_11700 [Rubrobacter sp.]|nr:hypothetical protein [Rubrobacter sp.]